MRGKHFGMCINVYALAFGLLKEHFNIAQIMTGNQYTGILPYPDRNLRHFGVAVGSAIGAV